MKTKIKPLGGGEGVFFGKNNFGLILHEINNLLQELFYINMQYNLTGVALKNVRDKNCSTPPPLEIEWRAPNLIELCVYICQKMYTTN